MRTTFLAAMMATATAASAAEPPDPELLSIIERQQQQIEILQQQLDSQRDALEALRRQVEENVAATGITLTGDDLERLAAIAPRGVAAGLRYPEAGMRAVNR